MLVLAALGTAARNRDNRFLLKARIADASGLRKDFFVKVGGVPVGRVTGVDLDRHDVAVVSMRLDRGALPIGRDARATVRPSSLLGEHHIELSRGDVSHPAPSGTTLPLSRTSTAIELDQVLAALDEPTRAALGVFLTESGDSLVGRGGDLAATLRRLPPTLEQATQVIDELGHDNAALGRLLEDSDRLVRPLARERRSLGRLVATGERALKPVAARRTDLGASIAGGPRAIVQLRRTLRRLRSLSRELVPAADGLRASAQPLTAILQGLTPFAAAATPLLGELKRSSASLRALGVRADPTVRRLLPVVHALDDTATSFEPTSQMLDRQTNNLIAFFEGYARAMKPADSLGHLYMSQTVFENLGDAAQTMALRDRARRRAAQQRRHRRGARHESAPEQRAQRVLPDLSKLPRVPRLPKLPGVPQPPALPALPDGVPTPQAPPAPNPEPALDYLLKP